jgi:hypothetical protein
MPGPPSLLETEPELKARFLGFIRDGVPRAYAALGCGFSYDTLYGWVRRGLVPDAPEPYASFARDLYHTEVTLLQKWLRRAGKASVDRDNKVITWLLERRFPKAFGRNAFDPADPAEDLDRELRAAQASAGQLTEGGDAGALDEERWSVMEEWFYARPARLLELARKTGLAQAAVEQTERGDTKS